SEMVEMVVMEVPSSDTIGLLCRLAREAQLMEDHHSVADLLAFIRSRTAELQRAESALMWLLTDSQVNSSQFIAPAIEGISRRSAEAVLTVAREQEG
ncbi:MAG: hypothetical protein NWE89_11710, partial [Candidatus Bathyarchaeota archaeon]|nr:hypothetical protein [Candidatus Bathyarchaeota archaeon]